MKKFSLTAIIALLLSAFSAQAQDSLIPVKKAKANKQGFYDKEISRLLIPTDTEFGMLCIPSFSVESSLAYDPKTHALVYIEADSSIWSRTFNAINHEENYVWRSNVLTQYRAPGTHMYIQPIPDEMAKDMKKLWKAAIKAAKTPKPEKKKVVTEDGKKLTITIEEITLDGTGWEYFCNGKRAKIQGNDKGGKGKVGDLINLTIELREAVRNHDAQKLESLHTKVKELRQMFK